MKNKRPYEKPTIEIIVDGKVNNRKSGKGEI